MKRSVHQVNLSVHLAIIMEMAEREIKLQFMFTTHVNGLVTFVTATHQVNLVKNPIE